jgi:EmrB/QacA subfamily drug resistance transporter
VANEPRRYLILGICCLSLLIVGMDNTIVNVALPSLRTDLDASVSGLQWTVDAYTLVLASLLVLAGSTGDRIGRRRTFQTGLAVFSVGSLLCSLAPSLGWLIAFRMVQAVGGSMLNPVAMSIITNVFTDPRERAKAIGVWSGVIGLSFGVGPVIGGALVEWVDWRAIFWINVPIGVAAFVLAARYIPESKAGRTRRPDPVGQVLVIAILGSLTYSIIEAPRAGWASAEVTGLLAVTVVALVAFVVYESRRADPLIELRFFRSAPFSGATIVAVSVFASFSGLLFLTTLYLQDVRGLSPAVAGAILVPMAVVQVVVGPQSGRLVAARGARLPLSLSGIGLFAGAACLVGTDTTTSYALIVTGFVLFAIGFALVNAPITNTAVSGMPREQAGVAAAIASTSRQVGATLGVAIAGSILSASAGGSIAAQYSAGASTAWWFVAGLGLLVVLVGTISTSGWAQRTAAATRAELESADGRPGASPAGAVATG